MPTDHAFWIDHEYDLDRASDGVSRYGAYLRDRRKEFRDHLVIDDGYNTAPEFAALAWRIARGPIMSPPYVRSHRRVISASVGRSNWDGRMVAAVSLVAPRPEALRNARTPGDGPWYNDRECTRTWGFEDPSEQEVARAAYMTTDVTVQWSFDADLPLVTEVPKTDRELFLVAGQCLRSIIDQLNEHIDRVIGMLPDVRDY